MSPKVPQHVAVVMDGNRRWAKKNNLPAFWGHRRGARVAGEITKVAIECKIAYLTLFAFSTENWKRFQGEIDYLMRLFLRCIERFEKLLLQQDIRIGFIGDLTMLPKNLFGKITAIQEQTRHKTNFFLTIAVSYGSRDEVIRAIRKMSQHESQNCSWEVLRNQLDTRHLPDVDLFIRTSGEQRLSNFLLLQSAYAEFFFIEKYWPEFTNNDFKAILLAFSQRQRNFGA